MSITVEQSQEIAKLVATLIEAEVDYSWQATFPLKVSKLLKKRVEKERLELANYLNLLRQDTA